MVLIFRGYVSFRDCILFNKCDSLWWHLKIQYLFCFSQFLQIWNPKAVLAKKTVSLQELKSGVQRFRKVYVYTIYICIWLYDYKNMYNYRNQTKSTNHMYLLILLSDLLKKFISAYHFRLIHLAKNHPGVSMTTFFSSVTRLTWPGLEGMTCQAGKKKSGGKTGKAGTPQKMEVLMGFRWFFPFEKNQVIF